MFIDIYTKGILTIIAIALTILCFQNLFSNAIANESFQKVIICSYEGDCANVTSLGKLEVYN